MVTLALINNYSLFLFSVPPGPPQINGPTFILEGNSITLSCSSSGGNPTPTVKWYEGSTLIDETQTESGGTSTNDYTFIAQPKHHLAVFECQVDNNVLQNPLTSTWFFQVYGKFRPNCNFEGTVMAVIAW